MEDNFADVYPLAKKLDYMRLLLSLRPRTLLPITPQEEERMIASLPETTAPVLDHPTLLSTDNHSLEHQHNPYTHRFRRKLILRKKKRESELLGQPFNLDRKVRETLEHMDYEETRLAQFHSNKSLHAYVATLSVPRSVPAPLMSKLRRTDHIVADEPRFERRRNLAAERIPELPQTLLKLQQLEPREQMMTTWIAHENDLALGNLKAMEAHKMELIEHQQPPADAQSSSAEAHSQETHEMPHHQQQQLHQLHQTIQQSTEASASMEVTPNLPPKEPTSTSAPSLASKPKDSIKDIASTSKPERYSIASTITSQKSDTRAHSVLTQLRELERKSSETEGAHSVMTSLDMERYLQMTVRHVENLADETLDVAGNPLSFEEELYGDVFNKRATLPIVSPFSGRSLKPIIRQDYETECKKLLLLREVETRFHMAQPEWIAPPPSPIEYRYLRPFMIKQVNKLLQDNFWPGIDISESILYPEYSIVVMYKELVIGCAFVTTLGYITYICVHPEWRSSGIAKFMLYHLIQTSPGKDITLHVSTTNPAIKLYQQFCFLIEETVPNFYHRYLPADSRFSKDAFFMRLRR